MKTVDTPIEHRALALPCIGQPRERSGITRRDDVRIEKDRTAERWRRRRSDGHIHRCCLIREPRCRAGHCEAYVTSRLRPCPQALTNSEAELDGPAKLGVLSPRSARQQSATVRTTLPPKLPARFTAIASVLDAPCASDQRQHGAALSVKVPRTFTVNASVAVADGVPFGPVATTVSELFAGSRRRIGRKRWCAALRQRPKCSAAPPHTAHPGRRDGDRASEVAARDIHCHAQRARLRDLTAPGPQPQHKRWRCRRRRYSLLRTPGRQQRADQASAIRFFFMVCRSNGSRAITWSAQLR